MPKETYPTYERLSGPWLLDNEQLKTLETNIQEKLGAVRIAARQRYDAMSNAERSYWSFQDDYSVSVVFADGATLEGKSIAEISEHPSTAKRLPIGLEITALIGSGKVGRLRLDLQIKSSEDEVMFRVTSDQEEEAQTVFFPTREWLAKQRPSPTERIWRHGRFASFFLIFTSIWFFGLFGIYEEKPLEKTALQLLKQGINSKNQNQAIELILRNEFHLNPGNAHLTSQWWPAIMVIVFLISAVLFFPPKLNIGIGRGSDKVDRYRTWSKLARITVPMLILTGFLIPGIRKLMGW